MIRSGKKQKIQVAEETPFANQANGFTSNNTQSAIEEAKLTAQGFPRAGISSVQNGTVGNNDWLGPNELLPNTPFTVFPLELEINEITWSNSNSNVAFDIQFRTGSKTGAIFYTLSVTSPNSGNGYVSGLSYSFPAGTTIWAQYKDNGTNMSDASITLWVSRIT